MLLLDDIQWRIVEAKEPVVYEAPQEQVEKVPVQIVVKIDWTPERIEQEVREKAQEYGVSFDQMWATMKCENPHLKPDEQSWVVQNGVREESYGLAQFWLPAGNKTPDGKVITKEIAVDPGQAIEAMAWHFSQGRASLWTCYRKLYM